MLIQIRNANCCGMRLLRWLIAEAKPSAMHPLIFHRFTPVRACAGRGEILAHVGDLMDWALSMADGTRAWHDSEPLPWDQAMDRFFAALKKFDDYLASSQTLHASSEKLLQGPIADALTHVGQIAILRRLAGEPIKAENYFQAEITAGRVGIDQAKPKREF